MYERELAQLRRQRGGGSVRGSKASASYAGSVRSLRSRVSATRPASASAPRPVSPVTSPHRIAGRPQSAAAHPAAPPPMFTSTAYDPYFGYNNPAPMEFLGSPRQGHDGNAFPADHHAAGGGGAGAAAAPAPAAGGGGAEFGVARPPPPPHATSTRHSRRRRRKSPGSQRSGRRSPAQGQVMPRVLPSDYAAATTFVVPLDTHAHRHPRRSRFAVAWHAVCPRRQ